MAPASHALGPEADCSDFSRQRAAQRFFDDNGGPEDDVNRLDLNRNGVACERLPCPCNRQDGAKIGFSYDPRVAHRRTPITLRFRAPRRVPTRSSLYYSAEVFSYPSGCFHDLSAGEDRYRARRGADVRLELRGVDLNRAGRVRRVPWCLGRHWGRLYVCTHQEAGSACDSFDLLAYFTFRVIRMRRGA